MIALFVQSAKTVDVHYTEIAPEIDGFIEDIWLNADSAHSFVQYEPYEKQEPEQKTSVYVLQDKENIYFAFRCYADKYPPFACFTKDEDYVRVSIDPFGTKTTGYYFLVFGSGLFWDGWVLDDGRNWDDTWEGIWYRGIQLYEDRLEVEIKIPFKSIRYKKDLDKWGVQFFRYTVTNHETDYWTELDHSEGELVSQWGTLENVNPQASGYYFELYPEGYVRYDKHWFYEPDSTTAEIKPSASLNMKWDITPQTTVNGTIYPDFAQIESDPFTLNLSRYPTYLEERRPFFIEGRDIFHMSDFGDWGFFQGLELYYSRRIGKSVNSDAIPIISGVKFTHKSQDWNIGLLSAYTDDYEINDTYTEPHRGFGVFRLKHSMTRNTDLGILCSGIMENKDNYNYALGIDAVYRKGADQYIVQGAFSEKNAKQGFAFSTGFHKLLPNFRVFSSAMVVQDSFDVSDVGYVPWAGMQRYRLFAGPYWNFAQGFFREIGTDAGLRINREPGETDYSYDVIVEVNPEYRNRWGNYFSFSYGKHYDADTEFTFRSANVNIWGPLLSQQFNTGCYYSYEYNYGRGYPAYQGSNWFTFSYSIIPNLSTGVFTNLWIEWDTTNTIISMVDRLRPNFFVRFSADMSLTVFSEFVMLTPGSDISEFELYSVRPGVLFTWNFRPKSWLYLALNDYHAQDAGGDLKHQYMISAVKMKYLLYF
jgi:hypothetical protein